MHDPENENNADPVIISLRETESVSAVFIIDLNTFRDKNLQYLTSKSMENLYYNLSEEEFSKGRKILLWGFAGLFFLAGVYVLIISLVLGHKSIPCYTFLCSLRDKC